MFCALKTPDESRPGVQLNTVFSSSYVTTPVTVVQTFTSKGNLLHKSSQ